jgi:phosphonate transport system substrate-binding protein
MPFWKYGAVAVWAGLVFTGCGRAPSAGEVSAWPKVLHFSVSIYQENPEAEGERLQPVRRYLERRMQMPAEVTGTSGYGVVIEAFRAKKLEGSTLGPFAYVIGSERASIEAIVTRGTPAGDPSTYAGTLVVKASSPMRSIDDVVHHARELTVSFVDPASTSGNLVQRVYLNSLGLSPERDFRKVVYSTQHVVSALTLLAGKVDVAAVSTNALQGLIQTGKFRAEDIRTLWVSPGIPESPVVVRKDLPAAFKAKLQQALADMASEAPEAYLNMSAKVFMERYRNTRFVTATDATYEPIRKLALSAAQLGLTEQ